MGGRKPNPGLSGREDESRTQAKAMTEGLELFGWVGSVEPEILGARCDQVEATQRIDELRREAAEPPLLDLADPMRAQPALE